MLSTRRERELNNGRKARRKRGWSMPALAIFIITRHEHDIVGESSTYNKLK